MTKYCSVTSDYKIYYHSVHSLEICFVKNTFEKGWKAQKFSDKILGKMCITEQFIKKTYFIPAAASITSLIKGTMYYKIFWGIEGHSNLWLNGTPPCYDI